MPTLLTILIVRLLATIVKAVGQAKVDRPRPLCTECTHAHVQYAVNGRRAIACTFAGTVRPVQIDVMYCTDYRDRNAAPRLVQIGFVPPIVAKESPAEVASVEHRNRQSFGKPSARYGCLSACWTFRAQPAHSNRSGPARLSEITDKASRQKLAARS